MAEGIREGEGEKREQIDLLVSNKKFVEARKLALETFFGYELDSVLEEILGAQIAEMYESLEKRMPLRRKATVVLATRFRKAKETADAMTNLNSFERANAKLGTAVLHLFRKEQELSGSRKEITTGLIRKLDYIIESMDALWGTWDAERSDPQAVDNFLEEYAKELMYTGKRSNLKKAESLIDRMEDGWQKAGMYSSLVNCYPRSPRKRNSLIKKMYDADPSFHLDEESDPTEDDDEDDEY